MPQGDSHRREHSHDSEATLGIIDGILDKGERGGEHEVSDFRKKVISRSLRTKVHTW